MYLNENGQTRQEIMQQTQLQTSIPSQQTSQGSTTTPVTTTTTSGSTTTNTNQNEPKLSTQTDNIVGVNSSGLLLLESFVILPLTNLDADKF